jgi:hypothetical protein
VFVSIDKRGEKSIGLLLTTDIIRLWAYIGNRLKKQRCKWMVANFEHVPHDEQRQHYIPNIQHLKDIVVVAFGNVLRGLGIRGSSSACASRGKRTPRDTKRLLK